MFLFYFHEAPLSVHQLLILAFLSLTRSLRSQGYEERLRPGRDDVGRGGQEPPGKGPQRAIPETEAANQVHLFAALFCLKCIF